MRKGFTLIELLIVLAVIAALMAIVTPIALNAVSQAKATQVASNFRNIKSAIESYVNIERTLPSTWTSLSGYLSSIPADFDFTTVTWDANGAATVTIVYNGTVDVNKLRSIYDEINTSKQLIVRLRRWW
ncbi:MAG: type II secretion system protein [Pseudothermotoga sp.]